VRKILPFLFLLSSSLSTGFAPSPYRILETSTFRTSYAIEDEDSLKQIVGTAWCAPGFPHTLITAGHTISADGEVSITDHKGIEHPVSVRWVDTKKDIALLTIPDNSCVKTKLQWTVKNADPGTPAFIFGYGGAFSEPLMDTGIISSKVMTQDLPSLQVAQVNGLLGHSGSVVVDAKARILGMLIGGYTAGDHVNVVVPVEELRKVLK
jgi:S1-C subfamily serine protease